MAGLLYFFRGMAITCCLNLYFIVSINCQVAKSTIENLESNEEEAVLFCAKEEETKEKSTSTHESDNEEENDVALERVYSNLIDQCSLLTFIGPLAIALNGSVRKTLLINFFYVTGIVILKKIL